MGKQFELQFNNEKPIDQKSEFKKADKMLFEIILDKIRSGKDGSRIEFQKFIDLYKDDKGGMDYLLQVYNDWAESNDYKTRFEVVVYEDKFGHSKYQFKEVPSEAA